MRRVIVETAVAIAWLTREGVEPCAARQFIYRHSFTGQLPNHGGSKRGEARWDLAEIRAIMWPKTQDEHPLPSRHMSA